MLAGVLAFSAFAPRSVWANSKFLNVQGKLTDTSGNPLTGTKTVTFRLYTSSTVAVSSAVWVESLSVALSTGLFNVSLGYVASMDTVTFNQLYYLGIQVSGDSNELSPRQQLGASAYAQGSLGNFNVGNNLIVSSSVTAGGAASIGGGAVVVGTMTVQGNAFSVGGATLAVSGGRVGIGTSNPAALLHMSSGTLLIDGTGGSFAIPGGSVTASAFFGDGSHLNNLPTLPAGTVIAVATGTVPNGWLECNGVSYSTVTYPILFSTIGCTWGCADGTHFNVPDLRGMFARGWNHGRSTDTYHGDQDAVSRSTGAVGGAGGDAVGSYQEDEFRSHTHVATGDGGGVVGNGGGATTVAIYSAAAVTGSTGSDETRPKNAYVMYIIKYDNNATTVGPGGNYVSKAGDTMSGGLTMNSAPITLSGSAGYVTGGSSVTASAFFGNGAALTSLNASSLASGTVSDSLLDSSSVTLQGNAFNGQNQLVKLDGSSPPRLPAVDGSQLVNLPAQTGGAVLGATQTFTGANTFASTVTIRGLSGLGLGPGLMVLVSSGSFTNVTIASVTLPSQYSTFLVMGRLQNTNAAARSLMLRIGGDAGNNYDWSTLDQYVSGTQLVGCGAGAWFGLTDSASNVNRVAASAWASILMTIEVNSSSVLSVDSTADVNSNDIATSASNHLQGTYTGSTQTQLNFGYGTVTSCTANAISATSASGVLYVFALPF